MNALVPIFGLAGGVNALAGVLFLNMFDLVSEIDKEEHHTGYVPSRIGRTKLQ